MSGRKPIRLRGHHIVCTLNFVGEGYSPEFVGNMERIVERLRGGEEAEERARRRDEAVLSFFGLKPGKRVVVRELWLRVGKADLEALCRGCEWFGLCSRVFAQREGSENEKA